MDRPRRGHGLPIELVVEAIGVLARRAWTSSRPSIGAQVQGPATSPTQKLTGPVRILGSALHPGRCHKDEPALHAPPLTILMIGGLHVEVNEVLALVGGHVNQELFLGNEYPAAENGILRSKIRGRLKLTGSGFLCSQQMLLHDRNSKFSEGFRKVI